MRTSNVHVLVSMFPLQSSLSKACFELLVPGRSANVEGGGAPSLEGGTSLSKEVPALPVMTIGNCMARAGDIRSLLQFIWLQGTTGGAYSVWDYM